MNASPAAADLSPADAHAALTAALSPPRLAEPTPAETWGMMLAGFSLGILAMLLLVAALSLVTRRRERRHAPHLAALDASRALAPERRLLVQAKVVEALLRPAEGRRPARRSRRAEGRLAALSRLAEEIGAALYAPRPSLDPEASEAAIRAALKVR